MTREQHIKANKLAEEIGYLEREIKGQEDAVLAGCKIRKAVFYAPEPDKEGYQRTEIDAKWLPEILLSDCLNKMKQELTRLEAEFEAL